jgi:hypothetical protein
MDSESVLTGPLGDRAARLVPAPPAFLSHEDALRAIEAIGFLLPKPISDVTLSGALTNDGGAYLELNVPSAVDGDSGLIQFLPSGGTCGGEVYLHLPGAAQGASYLGQLRCATEIAHGHHSDAYIGVNVFGGQGGPQYGRCMARHGPMVVPFLLSGVQVVKPWVAFHPSGLFSWRVYDVRVRKV